MTERSIRWQRLNKFRSLNYLRNKDKHKNVGQARSVGEALCHIYSRKETKKVRSPHGKSKGYHPDVRSSECSGHLSAVTAVGCLSLHWRIRPLSRRQKGGRLSLQHSSECAGCSPLFDAMLFGLRVTLYARMDASSSHCYCSVGGRVQLPSLDE